MYIDTKLYYLALFNSRLNIYSNLNIIVYKCKCRCIRKKTEFNVNLVIMYHITKGKIRFIKTNFFIQKVSTNIGLKRAGSFTNRMDSSSTVCYFAGRVI